jgi:hypothetical protein
MDTFKKSDLSNRIYNFKLITLKNADSLASKIHESNKLLTKYSSRSPNNTIINLSVNYPFKRPDRPGALFLSG